VTIYPVNDPPTLDGPAALLLNEDAPAQTVPLTGISAGPPNEAGQALTVTGGSSNPALISVAPVAYAPGSGTGTLTFTPLPDANGLVTIDVTVNDGQGANNTLTRSFVVLVRPVNDPPTLDPVNALTLNEDAPTQTVGLTGISAGDGESQPLA